MSKIMKRAATASAFVIAMTLVFLMWAGLCYVKGLLGISGTC